MKLSNRIIHYSTIVAFTISTIIVINDDVVFGVYGAKYECEYDCDHDSDCADGLICADDHTAELLEQNYNPKTAYCTVDASSIPSNYEVCYDPIKIGESIGPGTGIITRGNKQLCEWDCDLDTDCVNGLLCADQHMNELQALGYDPAKANCQGLTSLEPWFEVCFPSSLLSGGGSFGGTFLFFFFFTIPISLALWMFFGGLFAYRCFRMSKKILDFLF
jgi:hypothetical protein